MSSAILLQQNYISVWLVRITGANIFVEIDIFHMTTDTVIVNSTGGVCLLLALEALTAFCVCLPLAVAQLDFIYFSELLIVLLRRIRSFLDSLMGKSWIFCILSKFGVVKLFIINISSLQWRYRRGRISVKNYCAESY